jgi:ABC-type hemin transport system substrate-binding protein
MDFGKQIVGTTTFSNYPEEAKKIPSVGSYLKPNIEKIISLKPTQVLIFKEGDPSIKEALDKAKINYLVFDDLTVEGYPKLVQTLGNLFKKAKEADQLIIKWNSGLDRLQKLNLSKKIMIEVDHDPIFIAGHDTFLSEIFSQCGLKNVFSNLDGYKRISEESVMNRKPDIILVVGQLHAQMDFEKVKKFWRNNPTTSNAKVLEGSADTLSRLGPRLPQAVLEVCSHF